MNRKTWIVVLLIAIAAIGTGIGIYYATREKPEEIDLTAVAAIVDETEVLEADVTFMIENLRRDSTTGEFASDEDWAMMLMNADYTPESLREAVITNQFAIPIMTLNEAIKAGIEPDTATIDAQINDQKDAMGDDKAWLDYLKNMGFADEAAYRLLLEADSVVEPLMNLKYPSEEPTQAEKDDYLTENAPYLTNKKSSAIVIDVTDERNLEAARTEAEAAFALLEEGEDFVAVVEQYYSAASIIVEDDGNVGWSLLTSLPSLYSSALATLEVGEYSDIIEDEGSFYIILCTDSFTYSADDFQVSDIPVDLQDIILEYLPDYLASIRIDQYFSELLEQTDRIVINPMPEGLPYDVDMSLAVVEPEAELGIIDTVIGTGPEVQDGDLVRITYIGSLEDGTIFDASDLHEDGYLEFTVGSGVIDGMSQGVIGMKVGGKRILTIPPHLGYGSTDYGSIPGNSTLIFEIELLSVNGDDGSGVDKTEDLPEGTANGLGTGDGGAGDGAATGEGQTQ